MSVSPADQMSIAGQHQLVEYNQRVFASLRRVDQRRWADIYLRGLLLGAGRKSIRRTAEEVVYDPAIQSLQQFINQSPWDWAPVREQIATDAERLGPPEAWTVEYAITPKRGDRSAGVERRFVPTDGRILNCQVGIGVFATSRTAGVPVNWRLLLSSRWCEDPVRRRRARIPEPATVRSEPAEILDILDEMRRGWRLPARPLLAEWRRSNRVEELLHGLAARDQPFVVEVSDGLLVTAPRVHAPQVSGYRVPRLPEPVTVRDYLRPYQAHRRHVVTWTDGVTNRFARLTSAPVDLALGVGTEPRDTHLPALRLIGARGAEDRDHHRYWITNLGDWPVERVAALLGLLRVSRAALQRLSSDFGLRSFEGRSYPGWHHHMTMVSAAAAFANHFAELLPPPRGELTPPRDGSAGG